MTTNVFLPTNKHELLNVKMYYMTVFTYTVINHGHIT
jgi:hypothetical protein